MNNFVLIASIGYIFAACVAILDKFILTKSLKVGAYAFYSTFFFFGAFALLPFSDPISLESFFWALVSGLAFGFATWSMFLGLRRAEASHLVPFIGAIASVFVYGLSAVVLGEALNFLQTIGITALVVASLLFSYEKDGHKRVKGFLHPGFVWGLFSGILFAISHVATKYFYLEHSFITGVAWTKGLVGIVAILTLLSVSTRRDLFEKKEEDKARGEKAPHTFVIVFANKVFALFGTLFVQYAIAIGSVTIVSGLVGLQYALILIFALTSTVLTPRFYSEYFSKKEIIFELMAMILVVCGVVLLL